MTQSDIIQIIAGLTGSFCFGILFNIRGKKLAAISIGSFLSLVLLLILTNFISSEPLIYFIVSTVISIYSEIIARILKTPATPIITTSLIPLIPGGSLYHTITSAFEGNANEFLNRAVSTLKLASALALGIIAVTTLSQLIFKKNLKSRKNNSKNRRK